MAKKYKVHTKYVFSGEYHVNANNKKEAEEMVKKFCGLTIGNIHTVLDEEDIPDWNFSVHPVETKIKAKV